MARVPDPTCSDEELIAHGDETGCWSEDGFTPIPWPTRQEWADIERWRRWQAEHPGVDLNPGAPAF